MTDPSVVVLAGGFGGAKMSHGLLLAGLGRRARGLTAPALTVIVNTGDDLELHGLAVCPDLDTVLYTLAGIANTETGWGLRDETWSAAEMLARYGAETWFKLGDRDLATHLVRTRRLRSGQRLTAVTAELCARLGVAATILPMSDEPVRTRIRTADGWLDFQDWFVRRGQRDAALELAQEGAADARPTPEVIEAIAGARLVVLAPSNPFVSIGTILAVPGIEAALLAAAAPVVAITPIVAGRAIRGPADRMLESLGGEASAAGFVAHYRSRHPGLVDDYVIDRADSGDLARLVDGPGRVTALDTVMRDDGERRSLGEAILERFLPG